MPFTVLGGDVLGTEYKFSEFFQTYYIVIISACKSLDFSLFLRCMRFSMILSHKNKCVYNNRGHNSPRMLSVQCELNYCGFAQCK